MNILFNIFISLITKLIDAVLLVNELVVKYVYFVFLGLLYILLGFILRLEILPLLILNLLPLRRIS